MHPPSIWAVMPVKHLSQAKSRLSEVLGAERANFAKALLLHMLEVLSGAGVFSRILVITPDETIAALAAAKGADVAADQGVSLNGAGVLGLSLAKVGGADIIVLVHADLALLRAEDMRALLAGYLADGAPLGLVRCKNGEGTNIVFCERHAPFVPHFGPQSFQRHAALLPYRELVNENAAFDIDTAADLRRLAGCALDPHDPIAVFLARHSEIISRGAA